MAKRGGGFPGGMPGNMGNLMKQAQKMQRQMEEASKELEEKEVTAAAGGGAVEVTVSGKKEVTKVKIDPEAVDPDDVEMLEDMIMRHCARLKNIPSSPCPRLPVAWVDLAADSHSNQLKEKRKQNGLLQQSDKPSDRTTFRLAGNWTKVGAETGISYFEYAGRKCGKIKSFHIRCKTEYTLLQRVPDPDR